MTFTPDLSLGVEQRITLAADGILTAPINYSAAGNIAWTLYIVQDSAGFHSLSLDASYRYIGSLADPSCAASTQSVARCITAKNGITVITSIDSGLPLFQ